MTFSSAFRLAKSWTFWKVRARPATAMRCGGQPVMSEPSKRMRPALGVRRPEITLKVVVLPAPLGPIIAVTAPRSRANETWETATSPPKRMVTPSATSAAPPSVMDDLPSRDRDGALHHHVDEGRAAVPEGLAERRSQLLRALDPAPAHAHGLGQPVEAQLGIGQ